MNTKLCLSFAPPENWRSERSMPLDWAPLRKRILERDNYTCFYCGYKSDKYQIVHYIDDNPKNNEEHNLQTVCQMCNLILHAGQGCVVQGVVDLYKISAYTQEEIIQITRKLRDEGTADTKIVAHLRLKGKVKFKENRAYLARLFGFVTSRKPRQKGDMYSNWLEYHEKELYRLSQSAKYAPLAH